MGPNNYRRNATPFQWAMKMEQVIEENGLMMSEKIKELHDQLKVNHWSISYFLSISHQNKWHNWNALKKNHFLTNGGRGDNIGQIRDPKWIDTNGTNLVLLKIRFQYILATMLLYYKMKHSVCMSVCLNVCVYVPRCLEKYRTRPALNKKHLKFGKDLLLLFFCLFVYTTEGLLIKIR